MPTKTFETLVDEDNNFVLARNSIKLLIATKDYGHTPWNVGANTWKTLGAKEMLFANYVILIDIKGKLILVKCRKPYSEFLKDCSSVGLDFKFVNGKVNYSGKTALGRKRYKGSPMEMILEPTEETLLILKLSGIYDDKLKIG